MLVEVEKLPRLPLTSDVRQALGLPGVVPAAAGVVVQAVLLSEPRSGDPVGLLVLLLAQVVPRDQLSGRVEAVGQRVRGFGAVVFVWKHQE